MSNKERKSINNAIWLCSNCSINIDRDEVKFNVSLLKKWKQEAENAALTEQGKKLPSHNETIDTVAAALTGFPKSYIANAIANIHQATGKALEALDSRFLVKTAHDKGQTFIEIHAKENVPLLMNVGEESAQEYMEKYQHLIEHGNDIEMKSKAITFVGSKLFEEISANNNDGIFSLLSKKIPATQKLWLVQTETNMIESFDDIHGQISFGTKSFTFNGTACNKFFNYSYQKSLDASQTKADISMHLCFDQWKGLNLRSLPYFEKLSSLFSKMADGWQVFTSLEINGIKVLSSVGTNVDEWDSVIYINSLLEYINRCKIIANKLNTEIYYALDVSYTAEEHQYIANIANIIEGKCVYDKINMAENATCELIVSDGAQNIEFLTELHEPCAMRITSQIEDEIELFGVKVNLPAKIISLESVLPKIQGDIDKLSAGDVVTVEWIPQKDFKYSIRYDFEQSATRD